MTPVQLPGAPSPTLHRRLRASGSTEKAPATVDTTHFGGAGRSLIGRTPCPPAAQRVLGSGGKIRTFGFQPSTRMGSLPSQPAAAERTRSAMPIVAGVSSISSMIVAGPAGDSK